MIHVCGFWKVLEDRFVFSIEVEFIAYAIFRKGFHAICLISSVPKMGGWYLNICYSK